MTRTPDFAEQPQLAPNLISTRKRLPSLERAVLDLLRGNQPLTLPELELMLWALGIGFTRADLAAALTRLQELNLINNPFDALLAY